MDRPSDETKELKRSDDDEDSARCEEVQRDINDDYVLPSLIPTACHDVISDNEHEGEEENEPQRAQMAIESALATRIEQSTSYIECRRANIAPSQADLVDKIEDNNKIATVEAKIEDEGSEETQIAVLLWGQVVVRHKFDRVGLTLAHDHDEDKDDNENEDNDPN